jgi:hypothetical protein
MKKKTRSRVVNSDSLFGPPPVLIGEDAIAYDDLIGRVYAAIKPADVIDEMLIADVVASEWEFLRWSRLKLSLIQACAAKALKAFLKNNLDYDLYRDRFAEELAEILHENLPEDQAGIQRAIDVMAKGLSWGDTVQRFKREEMHER